MKEEGFTDEPLNLQDRCQYLFFNHWRGWLVFITPFLFSPLLFLQPWKEKELRCVYVIAIMLVYWIFEPLPIGATAMIPIVLFPLLAVTHSDVICYAYFNNEVFLVFGSMAIALAIELSTLNKRIALSYMQIVGTSQLRLQLGLTIIAALLSTIFSNVFIVALMCPVIKGILTELEEQGTLEVLQPPEQQRPDESPFPTKIVASFYLSVSYASSFGGLGTLMGTTTNYAFKDIYVNTTQGNSFDLYMKWMAFNILFIIISVILLFFWMQFIFCGLWLPNSTNALAIKGVPAAKKEYDLGKLSCHEIQVIVLLILLLPICLLESPIIMEGWRDLYKIDYVKSAIPVVGLAVVFFLLPINYLFARYWICRDHQPKAETQSILTAKYLVVNTPWNALIVIAGSYAVVKGLLESGCAEKIGDFIKNTESWTNPGAQFTCICVAIVLTLITPNLGMCKILLPFVFQLGKNKNVNDGYFAVPTTMALCMAFFLPVSTATNAIAAGYGNVRAKKMMLAGIGPTIFGILLIFLFSQTLMLLIW